MTISSGISAQARRRIASRASAAASPATSIDTTAPEPSRHNTSSRPASTTAWAASPAAAKAATRAPAISDRGAGSFGFSARAVAVNLWAIRPPNPMANPANSSQRSAADNHAIDAPPAPGAAAVNA